MRGRRLHTSIGAFQKRRPRSTASPFPLKPPRHKQRLEVSSYSHQTPITTATCSTSTCSEKVSMVAALACCPCCLPLPRPPPASDRLAECVFLVLTHPSRHCTTTQPTQTRAATRSWSARARGAGLPTCASSTRSSSMTRSGARVSRVDLRIEDVTGESGR